MYGAVWKSYLVQIQGCQPHMSSNIENWWERGDRWRHNAQHMMSFVEKKNVRKRCCWNCNIWPNWFTSHQSHYCLYYNGIPEFVRKRSMLNVVQYLKFHCQKVESTRNGKLRRLSGRFQTLIWRPGETVQNLEYVSWIIRESWQPWKL